MYRLERMELLGFKSFPERTEVAFPSGITVVVGPNGCGKSNLADALSWVLGEQSARAIRSEKMEDVIFGGTEGRRALGMAEVTLVLSRHGGTGNGRSASLAPAGAHAAADATAGGNGHEETAPSRPGDGNGSPAGNGHDDGPLTVSRRVFRNGESEYLMNGRRCRLRDIHDVLYGTGLGTRAYSVIEQGKVDTVLSGKPRERRLLLEEAAGILGYKVKKRAAWLKLEATQANLLRIRDLAGEVDRQIGSLKRQAARARRFRRLQEDSRRHTRWVFAHRRLVLESARSEMRRALAALAEDEARLAAALARAGAAAEERERRREEIREALRLADEALAALERRHDQHEAALRQLREQQGAAGEQGAALEAEATGLRAEAAGLAAEIKQSGREAGALAQGAARAATQAGEAEAEFKTALAALQSSSEQAEQDRRSLFEALDQVSQRKAEGATLEENLRGGRARFERLALERSQMRRDADEAVHGLESLVARRTALQAEVARAQEEGAAAARERKEREQEREARLSERATLAGRLEARQEFGRTLARLDAEDQAVSSDDALPRVVDFVEASPEIEAAVEAFAEGWLACRVLERGDLAGAWTRLSSGSGRYWLARDGGDAGSEGSARLAGAPPAALPPDPRIVGALADLVRVDGPHAEAIRNRLSAVTLVKDGASALELAVRFPSLDWVALDGTVVRAGGEVFRRPPGAPERGLLGRRRLSREAAAECAELRRALAEQEARAADLARVVRAAAEREAEASQRTGAAGRELASLAARESEAAISRQKLASRERLVSDEGSTLAAEIGRWEQEFERASEEIALGDDLRRALEASATAAQEEAERGREALSALHAKLEESRARQSEAERQRAVQTQRAETLARRTEDLTQRAEGLDAQAKTVRERAVSLEARIAEAQAALKAVLGERGVKMQDRSRLEQQAEELRAAAEAGQEEQRRVQRDLEQAREAARERQVAQARADSDWEHLAHECRQELDLALDEARPSADETPPGRATCESRLVELRDELNRMGPVNLLALDEYQELEKRQQFLSGQHKDLEASVESLRQTIQRLNRRSREQFIHAFEAIRVHFHELFRLLFGGGRAELRLEEGEDVLECGLEVNVQPPGKRLQSISLLSGGEKALSALALLFAIFRYKPSPFCLLDEVDAALDESNVERFLRIVRDFQKNTQFVLITHNKRSMEVGDLLYGVTMEEPGVSKLVSVNLS